MLIVLCRALKVPEIAQAAYSILCASSSIGFLLTALEPHLSQFNLSPFMMGEYSDVCIMERLPSAFTGLPSPGVMFVVNGGSYAMTAPLFGMVCDKLAPPSKVNQLGATAILISFLLLGPAPFLPFATNLPVCIAALVIHGWGIGAVLVSSFAAAHCGAIEKGGFPDDIGTYGMVSGLWTSVFALGESCPPPARGQSFHVLLRGREVLAWNGLSLLA